MSQILVDTLRQHFFEYVQAHCHQLVGSYAGLVAYSGELIFFSTTYSTFVAVAVTATELMVRNNAGARLEVPISDPDSIEQVEKLLQATNDQLL